MSQYLMIICCLWLSLVPCLAEIPRIQHLTKKSKRNGDSIEFLVVGDWGRGGLFNQSRVAKQMGVIGKKLDIDFIVSTGDNFYDNGLVSEEDPFFKRSFTNIYKAKSLQKPWYTVLGNHDYLGNTRAQVSGKLRKFDNRWSCKRNFVVELGMVDMFFVDTTPFVDAYFENPKKKNFDWKDILPRERYLSTVKQHLDLGLSESRAPWKIVVGHHTIRSIGHHGDTQEIVDQILPILEAHKVDMYINGHDHCLEHLSNSNGSPQFFTSGGGSKAWKDDIHHGIHDNITHFYYDGQGFMSVKITCEKAKVVFYDVWGNPMYHLNLRPQPKINHSKDTDA